MYREVDNTLSYTRINGLAMSSEECSKLPPQTFVLPQFVPLTRESAHLSLQRYERQKRREKRAKEILKEQKRKRKEWTQKKFNMDNDRSEVENSAYAPHSSVHVDEGLIEPRSDDDDSFEMPEKPNPMLVAGKKLISPLASKFCSRRYTGKPLQEMDDFYRYKRSFVVISGDKTIYRLSLSPALFVFGPFNPIRRIAIYIMFTYFNYEGYPNMASMQLDFVVSLTFHFYYTLFSMVILTAILCNCVFMALNDSSKTVEITFTVFYTCEAIIRVIGCGLIRNEFAYLRDAWNWLDFIVITLAYIMFVVPSLGNLSALRSLRVLRALKTVTAVRGLKTIIGALMDAVMHLRDVAVLTLFMLSIFALIGVQLYRGTLLRKCVIPWPGINTTAGGVILSQLVDDIYHNKTFDEDLSAEIKDIFNRKFPAFLGNYLSSLNVTKSDDFQLSDDMVTAVWSTLTNYSRWQVTEYFYEQKVCTN
ncbi:hypothetical protein ACTXT7_000875 [Hymenolepis weldensis]